MFISPRLVLGASVVAFSIVSTSIVSTASADAPEVVVVTATGIQQDLARVGDSITVLQPEQIRASQLTVASDLLSRTPGVIVTRNGGAGGTTALRIRGADTDQTVVLFDGLKLNDPSSTGGGYNFANMLLDDESRIEILRGPQSVLWGSQAIGGVINVVTPQPEGPLSALMRAELGGQDTGFVRGRVQSGDDRFAWRAGANYYSTEGVSAFDEDLGGRERDGYRNVGADFTASYQLNEAVSAEVRTRYADADSDFDGFPAPLFSFADTPEHGETQELIAYAGVKVAAPGSRWTHRLGYAYTDTDRQNFDPLQAVTTTTFKSEGENKRLEYFGTFEVTPAYQLSFGLQSEKAQFRSAAPSSFDPNPLPIGDDVQLDSGFAQLQASPIEPLSITLGVRYDDHDTFGSDSSARAAVAWSVAENTVLRATYGEGFKAPSLYQLYSEYGNTALAPEEAEGWDAGIEQRFADNRVVVSATYFARDTDNLIDFFSCFGNADPRCANQPFGFYENIAKTKAEGVELAFSAQLLDRLSFSANYTSYDAKNEERSSVNFGADLPRRPENSLYTDLSYAWPVGLTTSIAVQRVGKSFDDAANSIELDAHMLVDLRVNYDLSQKVSFYGRVQNLTDEDYATTANYGSIGRTLFGGVRLNF